MYKRPNKHCLTINYFFNSLNHHTITEPLITTKLKAVTEANDEKEVTVRWCLTRLEHLDIYSCLILCSGFYRGFYSN